MSVSERFTAGMGTIMGVQAVPIDNITDLVVLESTIRQGNMLPARTGSVLLAVDGVLYVLEFDFIDESFDQRTLEGYSKRRNPQARVK